MPVFGFGNVGGAVGEVGTAGFVTSGLVGLYPCDESTGYKLYDATGNLEPIVLSTGVQMDVTGAGAVRVLDAGLRAAHIGVSLASSNLITIGWEGVTPAASGTTVRTVIGCTTSNTAPVKLVLTSSSGRFTASAYVRAQKDGAGVATYTFSTSSEAGGSVAIPAETSIQFVAQIDMRQGADPTWKAHFRAGSSGEWTALRATTTATAANTAYVLSAASTGEYMLLADTTAASPTVPFLGKIQSIFMNVGSATLDDAKSIMDHQSADYIETILNTTTGRFWEFRAGEGESCRELITGTAITVTYDTTPPDWDSGLSGCYQPCLRQGNAGFGKAGVRIGGEDAYVPTGSGGISADAPYRGILSSADGWSFQITARVGTRGPASASQVLAYCHGDAPDGASITDPLKYGGAGFTISTDQNIVAHAKDTLITAATNSSAVVCSSSAASADNGLLTTYTIVVAGSFVSGTRNIAVWRQKAGESAPSLVPGNITGFGNSKDWRFNTAERIMLGGATYDADAVVGFIGVWHKPLTESEMAQCHRSAIARMTNQAVYVNSDVELHGNGSSSRPYSLLQDALRTAQPNQVIYIKGGGTHAYIEADSAVSTTIPSSTSGISIIGTGAPEIQGHAANASPPPCAIKQGSWTFRGVDFDGRDVNTVACFVYDGVTSVAFDDCEWRNAFQTEGQTVGSGLQSRCPSVTITNCRSVDNDEHGVYLRIFATGEEDAYDGTAVIDGLTITGCGVNGIRFSNEASYGGRWRNSKINGLSVDGGTSAGLYLLGCSDMIVTNVLLTGKLEGVSAGSSMVLGGDRVYSGETLVDDYICENLTVANVTIADSFDGGVYLDGDAGSITLRNIIIDGCAEDYVDATSGTCVIDADYMAGSNAVSEPVPDTGSNIPGATIVFVGATYVLDETSDGYGVGVNLTTLSTEAQTDLAGDPRPASGAWNMGAYR